jgi:hypothetical protein
MSLGCGWLWLSPLRHVIVARKGMHWTDFAGRSEARTFFAGGRWRDGGAAANAVHSAN